MDVEIEALKRQMMSRDKQLADLYGRMDNMLAVMIELQKNQVWLSQQAI